MFEFYRCPRRASSTEPALEQCQALGHDPARRSVDVPCRPISVNVAPQLAASSRARAIVTYGSSLLATTWLPNGSGVDGIGRKPLVPDG